MNEPRSLTDEGKAIAQKRLEGANEHKLAACKLISRIRARNLINGTK